MTDVVLDASAILAVIFDEPGAARVAEHLPAAYASTVNIAEIALANSYQRSRHFLTMHAVG